MSSCQGCCVTSDLTPAALMSGLFGLNRCAPLGEFSLLLLLLLLLDGVLSLGARVVESVGQILRHVRPRLTRCGRS